MEGAGKRERHCWLLGWLAVGGCVKGRCWVYMVIVGCGKVVELDGVWELLERLISWEKYWDGWIY